MPDFEAKIIATNTPAERPKKSNSKRSALEETLGSVLEVGQGIGAFARREFNEIMARIPELPITDAEFESLQKSDPEVAGVLLKEQNEIMNEIGRTIEEIRMAERKDPHCIHYEKIQALYERLDRLENGLPLMNLGGFNNKVLSTAPVPTIELARLNKVAVLQKNIKDFLRAHLSVIKGVMPAVFMEDMENFTRGLATGIVEVGADITAFFEMITENPEQFLRSFKLLAKYLYDQGPYEVIAKLHSTAVDKTLSFIDSTVGTMAKILLLTQAT